ncbi:SPFH domain-containing protein [Corallococcus sp. Z5C101001]|uniref:SPFH domain-containing protein n=1 Tax=Corallococcus sp. Z5C101001 TaxID=2596829 RepID=UPI00163D82E5|nr:SPFH domain-containing protein [Corallococcus sp. Z5C101001]
MCFIDARGTTVIVDLWLEFRIADPAKALFDAADWDRSLNNLVTHSAISILGNRDFQQIPCDRTELGELLQRDVAQETARWGLQVDAALIRSVSLLSEVGSQVLETLCARLERARADIEEEGRQRVALLEAETDARIAAMVAEAKGQSPAAVGKALHALSGAPEVLRANQELYRPSLIRPHRTIAFTGFAEGELRSVDAAMLGVPGAQHGEAHGAEVLERTPKVASRGGGEDRGRGRPGPLLPGSVRARRFRAGWQAFRADATRASDA